MITNQQYLLHFARATTGTSSTRIISLSGDLDFGSVEVGDSSSVTLTIANLGNETLSVSAIALPTGVVADWTSGTIATSANQSVTLTYTPTAAETLSDSLVVSSDATSGIAAATLTGTATEPAQTYTNESLAYFSAVETAGVTLSTSQMDAFDAFVITCQSAGLWNKFLALYPLMGATAATHAINAKAPGSYDVTWYGTVTHAAGGATSDGYTGQGDTTLIPSSAYTGTDAAVAIYASTGMWDGQNRTDFGVKDSDTYLCISGGFSSGNQTSVWQAGDSTNCSIGGNTAGCHIGSRTNNTLSLYRNGSAATTTSTTATALPSDSIYLLACHNNFLPSVSQFSFCAVLTALTDTEAGNLYNAIQTLQTSLGRNA